MAFFTKEIIISKYQSIWKKQYLELEHYLCRLLTLNFLTIEHVGSTAVPGCCAKPIIDCDIVVRSNQFAYVNDTLVEAGFLPLGTLGIEGRFAYEGIDLGFSYHLYVCLEDALSLQEHRYFREYLKMHPGAKLRYCELKKHLAFINPLDIKEYTESKTLMIQYYLNKAYEILYMSRPMRESDQEEILSKFPSARDILKEKTSMNYSFVINHQGQMVAAMFLRKSMDELSLLEVEKILIDESVPVLYQEKIHHLFEEEIQTQQRFLAHLKY